MNTDTQPTSRFARILKSHSALPIWVQVWMNFILGPVNLATLAFLSQPSGGWIAALALSGMAFTVAIVFANGGFSKVAAFGHLVPWTALVALLVLARPEGSATYQAFLNLLLVTNVISLAFDYNDVRLWLQSRGRVHRDDSTQGAPAIG